MSLLEVNNLSVRFGGLKALSKVNLHVGAGEMIGLIGPNGAGKTTLFNAVTGVVQAAEGAILFEGKELRGLKPNAIAHRGISRTFQNIRLFSRMSAVENVMIGLNSVAEYTFLEGLIRLPGARRKERAAREKAMEYLARVDMAQYRDAMAGALPYGLQRKLEIARAIATRSKLLLLDEPAAGMNNEETVSLIRFIRQLHQTSENNMSIVIIEHHLEVVMNLCSDITVFNLGEVLAKGSPDEIQNNPEVIRAYIGRRRRAQ